jgi:retinol dehydrogenase 14
VLITGRETEAGEHAAAAIQRESGQELARFLRADHATVGGNQQLADQLRTTAPGLDVLVNNVGGLYQTRWETADGYEATLAMNFLGPFTLTSELLPLLQANALPAASTWCQPASRCGSPIPSRTSSPRSSTSAVTPTPIPSC